MSLVKQRNPQLKRGFTGCCDVDTEEPFVQDKRFCPSLLHVEEPPQKEELFTQQQCMELVRKAVKKREEELEKYFTQEREQQFKSFQLWTQDYFSQNPCSYIS